MQNENDPVNTGNTEQETARPTQPDPAAQDQVPTPAPDQAPPRPAEEPAEAEDEPVGGAAAGPDEVPDVPEPSAAERGDGADDAPEQPAKRAVRTRRRAASRPAGPPPDAEEVPAVISAPAAAEPAAEQDAEAPAPRVTRVRATRSSRAAKKPAGPPPPEIEAQAEAAPAAAAPEQPEQPAPSGEGAAETSESGGPSESGAARERGSGRSRTRRRAAVPEVPAPPADEPDEPAEPVGVAGVPSVTFQPPMVVFQPPQPVPPKAEAAVGRGTAERGTVVADDAEDIEPLDLDDDDDEDGTDRQGRRRRRRGGRGRGKAGDKARDAEETAQDEPEEADESKESKESKDAKPARTRRRKAADKADKSDKGVKAEQADQAEPADEQSDEADQSEDADDDGQAGGTRRRRRRRRRSAGGDGEDGTVDDPPNTVVHVRESRSAADEVQSVKGSTRLEAKKQRRREGREQGRRRPPVITESEFLARRESVRREMVIRQLGERTQIGVLEDDVLVEHYVDRATHQSYVGNVYLGKVQNVLPSMEAAFVDVGKGRNAVLYAGEVNWDVAGLVGQPRRIESALRSGQSVLVQVTKDPLGHKGARLTSQISLPGRYLVYVPDGSMTGISRKLPDKERSRLKQILKRVMPDNAGVIVRTAAEGATEDELANDVSRLAAQWENIQRQAKTANAPALLHGEPDLTIRVVRDIFNEDFAKLVVSGGKAWDMVAEYVQYVAPHLADRVERWDDDQDVLGTYRIDEQIAKALERKVWLPSGGSLVIDRTEAMTVVDVNTGKFTGQGGNLEETVTRNNLEAAEEIVRQLRVRDVGGIIVIDFIDMVLESNRDLVLRRLLECLSRDRTKHQVAEVTSLGLVQMTRKRVGQGLLEAFSEVCECCNGRGIHVQATPVEHTPDKTAQSGGGRRRKRKGDVERVVEAKVARQEASKAAAAGQDAAVQAEAEDAAEAAAEAAESVPAALGDADSDVEVEAGSGKGDGSEASATSNGRRRRARRTRAKADTAEPA